jgi:phosphoribosylamine--glycine ligase
MAITGRGPDLSSALANAYATVSQISWNKAYFRSDIGKDILDFNK